MNRMNVGRCLLVFYVFAAVISKSLKNKYEEMQEYKVHWEPERTTQELLSERNGVRDSVIEAGILDHGYRFGFLPSEVTRGHNYTRFTMRIDFNVTRGATMRRIFMDIIEINNTAEGVPFAGFHYSSFSMMPERNRTVDIPIPAEFMTKWSTKPSAQIGFIFKVDFGFHADVKDVTAKRPVLLATHTQLPKCHEFACCLTSKIEKLEGKAYEVVIQPSIVRVQRCIDCLRVSEDIPYEKDSLNLIIHNKLKPQDVPVPAQYGKCRATEWDSLSTIFAVPKDDEIDVEVVDVPYFMPTACECVEDAIYDEDYIDIQNNDDHKANMKAKVNSSMH